MHFYMHKPLPRVAFLYQKREKRENISSNKTEVLIKSMNMNILVIVGLNQLFVRGPYVQNIA